jgi:hypothetical protein
LKAGADSVCGTSDHRYDEKEAYTLTEKEGLEMVEKDNQGICFKERSNSRFIRLLQEKNGKHNEFGEGKTWIKHLFKKLLQIHTAERDDWHHLVIGDESWFSSRHHHVACELCREMT